MVGLIDAFATVRGRAMVEEAFVDYAPAETVSHVAASGDVFV